MSARKGAGIHRSSRAVLLCIAAVLALPIFVLAGCGQKEEPASAPGYYSGPMKPKGAPGTTPGGQNSQNAPKGGTV